MFFKQVEFFDVFRPFRSILALPNPERWIKTLTLPAQKFEVISTKND